MLYTTSSPVLSSTTASATDRPTPASPPRSGRLRGLSYLRSYTHNHLHLRPSSPELGQIEQRAGRPSPRRAATEGSASPVQLQGHGTPTTPSSARRRTEDGSAAATTSRTPSPLQAHGWLPVSGAPAGSARPTTQLEPALSMGQRGAMQHDGQALEPAAPSSAKPALSKQRQTQTPKPTIQFIPYNDISSRSRPSLDFARISRTLPHSSSIIKVGRYSERDNNIESIPSRPSDYPVGFKSKVVSRKHCEFWCEGEQWYVRDVGSSSGTFLNHVRLSPPGVESKPFLTKDGDVLQLGIDFKGGEEMIFRCVKMRLECNRGWQKTVNKFNKSTHKQLRNLTRGSGDETKADESSRSSTECTICLNPIAPCQALFVAPCSHTWHFKCIRKLLEAPPVHEFTCPNCRAQAYLNADVEEPEGYAESIDSAMSEPDEMLGGQGSASPNHGKVSARMGDEERDLTCVLGSMRLRDDPDNMASLRERRLTQSPRAMPADSRLLRHDTLGEPDDEALEMFDSRQSTTVAPLSDPNDAPSVPVDIPRPAVDLARGDRLGGGVVTRARTPSASAAPGSLVPDMLAGAGPMTPRNNAGPFVLDGRDGDGDEDDGDNRRPRASGESHHGMTNLDSIV